jgi:hypothetical protein
VNIFGFGWKPLQVEKHDNWPLIDPAEPSGLTKGTGKEPRNVFFLHDWVSDPIVVIMHDHHKVSLFCPCRNYFAIMVRTGCVRLCQAVSGCVRLCQAVSGFNGTPCSFGHHGIYRSGSFRITNILSINDCAN